jgi:RNA polymerase sigma-70 factor (ECF subfamily)
MPEEIAVATRENPVDQNEWMQHCLNKLDVPARQATLAVMLEGLTCREAAAALNVPLGTILSRLHRARGLLRGYVHQQNQSRPDQGGIRR